MPPINQQGSRAGLITALVVFVVLFIVATICAFYFSSQFQAADKFKKDELKKWQDLVTDEPTTAPELARLKEIRERIGMANSGLLAVADKALADESEVITGRRDVLAPAAVDSAKAMITSAADRLSGKKLTGPGGEDGTGVTLPSVNSNLAGVVDALANAVAAKHQEMLAQARLNQDLKKQLADKDASIKTMQEEHGKQLAEWEKKANDAMAAADADRKSKQNQLEGIEADRKKDRDDAIAMITDKDKQIGDKAKENAKLNKDLQQALMQLGKNRADVKDPIIRQADGHIARLGSAGIVYIDRGKADHVTPGLTFEVYDKTQGIPGLGKEPLGNENLPEGKASIEVTNVGATSSECRVVKTAPGQALSEGDLIMNLVYDPAAKYNFVVYGKFDLAQSGKASDEDAAVIKRLVSQWGGKLANEVTVKTDFVVLGSEPEVPNYSKEELDIPTNAKLREDALAAREAYDNVREQAIKLHIPIMNQNRFLYFVGYYDLAKR